MAEVIKRDRRAVLLAGVFVALVVVLGLFAYVYTEPQRSDATTTLLGLLSMAAVVLLYYLYGIVRLVRKKSSYPPAIVWAGVVCSGLFVGAVWWTLELRSWNANKHILAWAALGYMLSIVVFIPLGCVAAYQTLGGWTWVVFTAAELFFLWLYVSTTLDYLFVDD